MDQEKIKILVCCHKKTDLPTNRHGILFPIHVGAALSNENLGIQRDDQFNGMPCDNISRKNKSYCELTALYWAWKNIKRMYPKLEYIGLNHYRRYFDLNKRSFFKPVNVRQELEVKNYEISQKKIINILESGYTILSEPQIYAYPIAFDYALQHFCDDLKILAKVYAQNDPNCVDILKKFLLQNNKLSHFNMFVMKWQDFDNYCNWLFNGLAEIEKYVNIQNYSSVQKRIYGYMAERLLNVFCKKNTLKIKYIPVIKYANQKDFSILYYIYRFIRCNIAFLFVKPPITNVVWNNWMIYAEKLIDEKKK